MEERVLGYLWGVLGRELEELAASKACFCTRNRGLELTSAGEGLALG